jgi:hypothetical protein
MTACKRSVVFTNKREVVDPLISLPFHRRFFSLEIPLRRTDVEVESRIVLIRDIHLGPNPLA